VRQSMATRWRALEEEKAASGAVARWKQCSGGLSIELGGACAERMEAMVGRSNRDRMGKNAGGRRWGKDNARVGPMTPLPPTLIYSFVGPNFVLGFGDSKSFVFESGLFRKIKSESDWMLLINYPSLTGC
jgi:hypothetical protein